MPLQPGNTLQGNYRILGRLGQGGMGTVYLAEHVRLPGRRFAVKEFLADPNASPAEIEALRRQFFTEAATLATLDHPNLTRVSDYFSEGGNEYLVMDYVEGEDLHKALERHRAVYGRPLPEKPVRVWAAQVLDALAYLLSRQPPLVHRDIKPANIILSREGRIKLVDFGLVKLVDPNNLRTATMLRMGSPAYAPIEQFGLGAGHTDARSDVYALGATLYHLLTGVPPPTAPDRVANPRLLLPPRAWQPELSMGIEAVVLRAMALRPEDRFASATAMRAALDGIYSGGQTEIDTVLVAAPRRRSRPATAALAGLALVALSVLGGWALLRGASPAADSEPPARAAGGEQAVAPASAIERVVTATVLVPVTLPPALVPGKFPEASTRLLIDGDLDGRSPAELSLMRNEVFARHGYKFKNDDLQRYFASQPWYEPLFDDVGQALSDVEKKNIARIVAQERKVNP